MDNHEQLVKALRCCTQNPPETCVGCTYNIGNNECNVKRIVVDAADAIEALQADIKRLKEANDELREKQTYIDHYGDRWMTSANDVPTAAYKHGYADGRDEAEAQMPKRGEWKKWADKHGMTQLVRLVCSECGKDIVVSKENIPNYCPNCGAKMIGEQNVE